LIVAYAALHCRPDYVACEGIIQGFMTLKILKCQLPRCQCDAPFRQNGFSPRAALELWPVEQPQTAAAASQQRSHLPSTERAAAA